MKHYRIKGSRSASVPSLIFEVKVDLQDMRSGYRHSDWGLYLRAPWIDEVDLEWTYDMVSRFDPCKLEAEESAPAQLDWPELADQKIVNYMIKYYRPRAWKNSWLGLFSNSRETDQDFVARCRDVVRERREMDLRKVREVFYHRFVELEQKLVRQAETDELGETWRARRLVQIQQLFNDLREYLSRPLLDVSRPLTIAPRLEIPPELAGDAETRFETVRREFVNKYNEVLHEYEVQAAAIEPYDVPLTYSHIEIVSRGILWG